MFNKKNDSIADSVKKIMEQNELFREIEASLLEEYGVTSRNALPHELHAEFDAVLAEAKKCAMEEEKLDEQAKWRKTKGAYTVDDEGRKVSVGDKPFSPKSYEGTPPVEKIVGKNKKGKAPKWATNVTKKRLERSRDAGKQEKANLPEESEQLDEVSKKTAISAYAQSAAAAKNPTIRFDDSPRDKGKQAENIRRMIEKKHGKKVAKDADRAAEIEDKGRYPRSKGLGYDPLEAKQSVVSAMELKPSKKTGKLSGKDSDKLKNYFRHFQKEEAEDINSIMEEIRNNLEAKLTAIHESGDEEAFEAFVNSLTEEQLEILGLNEMKIGQPVRGNGRPAAPAPATASNPNASSPMAKPAGMAAPAPRPEVRSNPQTGPVKSSPTASDVLKRIDKPAAPAPTAKPGGFTATGNDAVSSANRAAEKARQQKGVGGVMGGTGVSGAARPGGGISTVAGAGMKSMAQVNKRSDNPGGRQANMRYAEKSRQRSGGTVMGEETKPQIKESFESFLRNKFLKD